MKRRENYGKRKKTESESTESHGRQKRVALYNNKSETVPAEEDRKKRTTRRAGNRNIKVDMTMKLKESDGGDSSGNTTSSSDEDYVLPETKIKRGGKGINDKSKRIESDDEEDSNESEADGEEDEAAGEEDEADGEEDECGEVEEEEEDEDRDVEEEEGDDDGEEDEGDEDEEVDLSEEEDEDDDDDGEGEEDDEVEQDDESGEESSKEDSDDYAARERRELSRRKKAPIIKAQLGRQRNSVKKGKKRKISEE